MENYMLRTFFIVCSLITSGLFAQTWEYSGDLGDEEMIYGTASPSGDLYIFSKSLRRSTDHGASWSRLAPTMSFSARYHYPKIVWLPSGTAFMLSDSCLWRSLDSCNSWTKLKRLGPSPGMTHTDDGLLLATSTDNVLLTSDEGQSWTGSPLTKGLNGVYVDKDNIFYVDGGVNLYRSSNRGTSWETVNGLPVANFRKMISAPKHGLVLATTGPQIFFSTDSGRGWSQSQKFGASIISIVPLTEDTVFLMEADGTIHRATDGGRTWSVYSASPVVNSTKFLNLFVKDHNLFLLHQTGLFRSAINDTGLWQRVLIPTGKVHQLAAAPSGKIYAASVSNTGGHNKLWIFDTTETWKEETSFKRSAISEMVSDSNNILYSIIYNKVSISTDEGKSWASGVFFAGSPLRIALTKDRIYVASHFGGIYWSSDKGVTWEHPNIGTDTLLCSIATASGIVYAGGIAKFYRSTDGYVWEEPVFPFIAGSQNVSAIATYGTTVIVGVDRTGVYFSDDKGTLWENHSEGLGKDSIFALLPTPSGTLFLATTTGVYEYIPSMQIWKNVNEGRWQDRVLSLALGRDGKVYIGTNGDGVYRSTKTYGSWFKSVQLEEYSPNDISIYPNPASSEITISFKSDKPERYRIAIYNLLGESILVSSDEGTIDVSALHSGQYFLRIITDKQTQTLPLSIIK
jgi:photosystem II stability/assembly factor-like uncharacterized protein